MYERSRNLRDRLKAPPKQRIMADELQTVEPGEDAKLAKPLPTMVTGFYPPGTADGGARSTHAEDLREEMKAESIQSDDSIEIRLRNVRQLTDRL